MPGQARIGVDVGGTFTDLVLHDPQRDAVHTGKLLTTPEDPSRAIIEGVQRILREAGLAPSDLHSIVHGTTLVTNTVIERTGAKVRAADHRRLPRFDRDRPGNPLRSL